MPRSKPKAQRLAPPNSTCQSERDSHAHPTTNQANHADPSQRVAQRQERGNHSESLRVNQSRLNTSLTSPIPKRRERLANTSATEVLPENNHGQPRVNPSTSNKRGISEPSPNFIPGTVVDVDPIRANYSRPSTDATRCFQEGSGSLSPRIDRPSSPLSCATSDTASVALENCVPELEEFDDIVLPGIDTRRNPNTRKLKKRPSPPRDSKRRFSNSSIRQSSTSRARVSEALRAMRGVVADPSADPTSLTVSVPALEVYNPVRAERVNKRKNSSFIFISDDEAKSVFDHERASTDGSGVGVAPGDADKNKFGDYWKKLETVSIRRSAPAKTGARNSGQKRVRQGSNKASSLARQKKGSAPKMTESTGRRRATKQTLSEGNHTESEVEGGKHPITEENIDGGDAIAVHVSCERKPMKRGRSTYESFRRSSTKQSYQWQPLNTNDIRSAARLQNGLDDGEDTGGSTGFSESDGQACIQCGGHGKASKMVLCDVCSDGCHTFCMRPARVSVPLGVWICPRCHTTAKKHKVHLSKLPCFLETNGRVRE